MGAKDCESEKPPHRVTISQAFFMQSTEVTQSQLKTVMGMEPRRGRLMLKRDPVNRRRMSAGKMRSSSTRNCRSMRGKPIVYRRKRNENMRAG
ncbi:MAG TPA: hypothetical protein DIW81_11905 [Planctomycetaceae bacterium]|nr:hypothetical protein [Planctomycetaceae bacterium]